MIYYIYKNQWAKKPMLLNAVLTEPSYLPHTEAAPWGVNTQTKAENVAFDDDEAAVGAKYHSEAARLHLLLYYTMRQKGVLDIAYLAKYSFEGLDLAEPLVPPGGTKGGSLKLICKFTSFAQASFKNAKLNYARFEHCDFTNADFTGANVTGVRFVNCLMYGCKGLLKADNLTIRNCHGITYGETGDPVVTPVENNARACHVCGEDMAAWCNGQALCRTCWNEQLKTCTNCHNPYEPRYVAQISLPVHGRRDSTTGLMTSFPESTYCLDCAKTHAVKCVSCSRLVPKIIPGYDHERHTHYTLDDDGHPHCFACEAPAPKSIFGYSHKPPPEFRLLPAEILPPDDARRATLNALQDEGETDPDDEEDEDRDEDDGEDSYRPPVRRAVLRPRVVPAHVIPIPRTLTFGHELEVQHKRNNETLNKHAAEVSKDGFWYCKNDSSIGHGFEAVSHPFSWGWLKKNAEKVIKPKMEYLSKVGFRSWQTDCCGLHIHMSRDAFDTVAAIAPAEQGCTLNPGWRKFYSGGNLWVTDMPYPEGATVTVTRADGIPNVAMRSDVLFRSSDRVCPASQPGTEPGAEYRWLTPHDGNYQTFYAQLIRDDRHREPLPPSPHLYRFQQFFYNNPNFVRIISGRSKNHMSHYGAVDLSHVGSMSVAAITRGLASQPQRGMAVNLGETGSKTVEVRLFKGTLHYYSFLRAHQFCHSLFRFTRFCGNGQLTVPEYNEWVKKEKHEYPQLFNFMQERIPSEALLASEVHELEQ
jgi:hypothetical protein